MKTTCRARPDLEKLIPQSILDNVERECSRPECRSKDVMMRYFNNRKRDQPRYFCNGCKCLFTLGGKLRESYTKAKNKTRKVTARTKTNNLEAEGAKIGESSRKRKSIEDVEEEEEIDDSEEETDEEMEEIESETKDEDADLDGSEDENEGEGGESCPLDLNQSPHQENNLAREDEEMYEAKEVEEFGEETEELVDSSLPKEANVDCIPTNEVLESKEETPMVDTTLRDELHPSMLCITELLRLKALKHLLDAQVILEGVFIEKEAILMELEWNEIEQRRERENRDLYPTEEMFYNLKQRAAQVVSSWLQGPLDGARLEVLDARKASLEQVKNDVESFIREVREMENALIPHALMVRMEKKAKQMMERVVALTN